MCGIVSYFGPNDGVKRVLNALELLAYRAPDSSGLAVVAADGEFAVRRAVGTAAQLKAAIAANPMPPLRKSDTQVVVGHGRWAMVGAVTEANSHPISDRSGARMVCENGSHNASLMLGGLLVQEQWWRARGVAESEPVHRTQNTTEVLVYEWERMVYLLEEDALPNENRPFQTRLVHVGILDVEEQALRLAVQRLRPGNAHACTFYSCHQPDTLYVTSHNKPIALISRTDDHGRQELMVASDVNAALMLWSRAEVETAVTQIENLQANKTDPAAVEVVLDQFTVDVIFLDDDLNHGRELFARITASETDGRLVPQIEVSRYDGTPIPVVTQSMRLNPALVGKRGYPSYTESHIAEIPDVIDGLVAAYVRDGEIHLESIWREGKLFAPGLNLENLATRFGENLEKLQRVLLIGEGSSWRDAQAAAPFFRELLPGVLVITFRPIQVLNLGEAIDPTSDLAIEISWSGTTDSLLKVDKWLAEMDVMRMAITGRAQSDLGRRAARSGGTVDVRTGVEVSVATVKGFEAILYTLDLLVLQLANLCRKQQDVASLAQLTSELTYLLPQHVRSILTDDDRRERLRRTAHSLKHFNKFAVVGSSPIDIEAELKIEELAQVLARTFEFHDADLRSVIEHSAFAGHDRWRTLFIINATTAEAQREAQFILNYLRELGVHCLIHTTPHNRLAEWQALPNADVFISPPVSKFIQPLIDAPFFFDLAVAFAYARGLTADEVDRPRNLAKSVTTTGAEKRAAVEGRRDFRNVDLGAFNQGRIAETAWSRQRNEPSWASLRATVSLRSALAVITEPLPSNLVINDRNHLVVVSDTKATENGAQMAGVAWQDLLGIDLITYRRYISDLPQVQADTILLHFVRAGAVLALRDEKTIALPSDLSPLQLEILTAVYLMGLAVRLARHRGQDTVHWEAGLAQLPLLITQLMDYSQLVQEVNQVLVPYVAVGYDKVQIIGGGQDFIGAVSISRSFLLQGFMAEGLYTDSAWHGPLATVGGPDPEHDTLIIILATDPLFQAAALVDTQVYRTRHAKVILVVPEGNEDLPAVRGVDASAVLALTAVPRPFLPVIHAAFGDILARQMEKLWAEREKKPE
jgi:glucosamine 6-phosphate synthetase-like amidotransferase/phosphosugar isomerase protein